MRFTPVTAAAAAALLAVGCGGSSGEQPTVGGEQLARPGADWNGLSPQQRLEAVKDCRLAAAVTAGRAEGSVAAPFFSDRYRAVERVAISTLGDALTRFFAGTAHDRQTVQRACTTVALRLARIAVVARRPHVEFSLPVSGKDGPFTLTVASPTVRLVGRLSPDGARLTFTRPADRARSTARWTVRHKGDSASVTLRDVPLGVSYLRVVVSGPTGTARRLMVITRTHASTRRPPRTFQPVDMHGTVSKTLSVLYVPQEAVALVRSRSPLAISTSDTLVLTHTGSTRLRSTRIRPGLYRDVRIAAGGEWSVRIEPARRR
jgi:hypothetical protein